MTISLNEFVHYTDNLLQIRQFNDYCPNGLQVETHAKVKKIVTGVTASQALIEAAIEQQADTVLVHHGYFWKGEQAALTGVKARRIGLLFHHKINLIAYHLPLDAHKTLGNNAQLAQVLNFSIEQGLDDSAQPIGLLGQVAQEQSAEQFAQHIAARLQRQPLLLGRADKRIKKVAWCTGAAQSYMEKAIACGADAFITGEVSEQNFHLAKEADVAFIAAGHHATERYGVKALGEHLAQHFALDVQFVDIDNPV